MKRVLALQHVWDDPVGYLGELLHKYGIGYDVAHVETEPLPNPAGYGALLVLGGFQHAYDDETYPYFVQEKQWIRKAIEQEIPFLGICLGGQLLAHVLGGSVKRHTMTEIGFFRVQLTKEGEADPLYEGLPGYQEVFQWHEDIFDIPAGALRLATHSNAENQAFRYGRCAYGLQYHIELTPAMLDLWLHHPEFRTEIMKTLGEDGYHALEREQATRYPTYRQHSQILFRNFLRLSSLI
jgi:GMP synthase-like glutamine amidotransferase